MPLIGWNYTFHFHQFKKNLHYKLTFKSYLKQQIWIGKKSTFYPERFCRYKSSHVSVQNFEYSLSKFPKLLFQFKKVPSPLYSFCESVDEMLLHIFHTYNVIQSNYGMNFKILFLLNLMLEIIPQNAFFRFFGIDNQKQNLQLINRLLLTF